MVYDKALCRKGKWYGCYSLIPGAAKLHNNFSKPDFELFIISPSIKAKEIETPICQSE